MKKILFLTLLIITLLYIGVSYVIEKTNIKIPLITTCHSGGVIGAKDHCHFILNARHLH